MPLLDCFVYLCHRYEEYSKGGNEMEVAIG